GGNLDSDSLAELVVLESGSNSLSVLDTNETGGLLNPRSDRTFAVGLRPTFAVSGLFNADPYLDVAVLNADASLAILLGDAGGAFTEARGSSGRLSAGNLPSGLAVRDITGDGRLDLLVGNE